MWTVAVLGILVFVAMALLVDRGVLAAIDERLLLALRNANDVSDAWGPPWFEETAVEFSALGGYPILVTVAVIVVTVLLLLGHGAAASFLAVALLGGSALSTGVKLLFARARPDLVDHMDRTFTSSFPSGHAMVSMLAYMTLAVIAIRFVPRHTVRVFIVTAALGVAILIGMSRVYLGVHWPSDVIAGWALGLSWASLCWLAAHYMSRERGRDEFGHSAT